jgi:hypothetical protein
VVLLASRSFLMPDIVTQRNIGAYIVPITSVDPQSSTGGTIDGTAIDRAAHGMPGSCVMHQRVGALSGTPSTTSVISTLQHSPDDSTWTNYTDPDTGAVASTAALTAATTGDALAVDLTLAYRYVRIVMVVAFTGGSSPSALVYADIIVGGEPANQAI